MFVAPLNYDRFFKKIFSDLNIAKCFLEDFLDVTIESIEMLPLRHRLTDEAMVVEFDYRCKINGQYVIVDMQQWYKIDIGKRFYLYHCLNAALQLEDIPTKSISVGEEKKRTTKDYSLLEPTITIIWMADDTFGTDESLLSFVLLPDLVLDMVLNDELWRDEHSEVLKTERERAKKVLTQTRQLGFLRENKLIYAFQKNIVRDKKYKRYIKWFKFAEKSKNRNNKKEDFKEFLNDKIIMEVINRLDKSTLEQDDFQYITDYEAFNKEFKQFKDSMARELRSEIIPELRTELIPELRTELRSELIPELRSELIPELRTELIPGIKEEVREEVKEEFRTELEKTIKVSSSEKLLLKGLGITEVAYLTELTEVEVTAIAQKLGLLG